MDYYLYVSQTKVEMLHSQIPADITRNDTNIYQKCSSVRENLKKSGKLGKIDSGEPWIEGTVFARFFQVKPKRRVIFFFCMDQKISLALGGSSHHLIGHIDARVLQPSLSYEPFLLDSLHELLEFQQPRFAHNALAYDYCMDTSSATIADYLSCGVTQGQNAWVPIIADFARRRKPEPQKISFVAKSLIRVPEAERTTVLATPLFVKREG